jgi:hypothetical protein
VQILIAVIFLLGLYFQAWLDAEFDDVRIGGFFSLMGPMNVRMIWLKPGTKMLAKLIAFLMVYGSLVYLLTSSRDWWLWLVIGILGRLLLPPRLKDERRKNDWLFQSLRLQEYLTRYIQDFPGRMKTGDEIRKRLNPDAEDYVLPEGRNLVKKAVEASCPQFFRSPDSPVLDELIDKYDVSETTGMPYEFLNELIQLMQSKGIYVVVRKNGSYLMQDKKFQHKLLDAVN